MPDFARFLPDFTRLSKFNNFSNFDARNLLDHLNESPESPLSEFSNSEEISIVDQKIDRGRKPLICVKHFDVRGKFDVISELLASKIPNNTPIGLKFGRMV